MKQTVFEHDFIRAFEEAGRKDQFTRDALAALYDYFEQTEQDTGEELELDVVAICCDYSEDQWADIAENYSIDLSECADDDEREQAVIDFLADHTVFIMASDGLLLYQQF